MKVFVPKDHGATDILREDEKCVVVRPHHYEGDSYIAGWYNFQAINDTGRPLQQARILIEDLAPGIYQPYWDHSVWSRDGKKWERIPATSKEFSDTTLTIETPLGADESRWVAVITPMPYSWYEQLCEELATPPSAADTGWTIERRQIGDSVEGRPIYSFRVQHAEGPALQNLLLVAGQHAVEQSGKMFAENLIRGYRNGQFRGTVMEQLLQTHNVTVVPLVNPDGCYHGRMNSNVEGFVINHAADNSIETQAVLTLIDELQPHVLINCHGWGNEVGELPFEDIYRFTDDDPLFKYLVEHVPGCSSSGTPHFFTEIVERIERYAHDRFGTNCTITEVNYHWFLPPDGSAARQPTRADIDVRIWQYLTAIAGFCIEDSGQ